MQGKTEKQVSCFSGLYCSGRHKWKRSLGMASSSHLTLPSITPHSFLRSRKQGELISQKQYSGPCILVGYYVNVMSRHTDKNHCTSVGHKKKEQRALRIRNVEKWPEDMCLNSWECNSWELCPWVISYCPL